MGKTKAIFTDRERKVRAEVYQRHWHRNHPEYTRDYSRDYRRAHPERTRRWVRNNYRRNRGTAHYKARKNAWQRRATAELRACYVRNLILYEMPWRKVLIPEKLIKLKQVNMRIRRELWTNQKISTS